MTERRKFFLDAADKNSEAGGSHGDYFEGSSVSGFPRQMAAPRVCRGRVQAGLVGVASADGFGEGVVDFEDDALGAVVAVELGLVVGLYEGVTRFALSRFST